VVDTYPAYLKDDKNICLAPVDSETVQKREQYPFRHL